MRLLCLVLLLSLTLPLTAQAPPGPLKVLVLPPVLRGKYLPMSSQQFMQVFADEIHRLNPKADVILPRDQDLAGMGYQTTDQPPSIDAARRLCAAYSATHACWLSVRFRPELTPATAGQPGILAMGAAARFWVMRLDTGRVGLDEPISVVRSGLLPAGTSLEKLEQDLGLSCAHDLAQQIVEVAQQRASAVRVAGWQKPTALAPPATSAGVKRMFSSIETYRNAIDSGDLISATDTSRVALGNWRSLSRPEQLQVEQRYPGTINWMEGGVYYNVNGSWR